MEKQRVTDQHYLAAGKRAIAEAFGTCEMLVIVGKDNLAVASTNATSSQALIIVARVAVNAARAPRAPAAMMMATATKAEISHARWARCFSRPRESGGEACHCAGGLGL